MHNCTSPYNKKGIHKIQSPFTIFKIILFILTVIMIYRIISISSETDKISLSYDFYTVLLPSELIIYGLLNLIFYSMYMRSNFIYEKSKFKNKYALSILIIWIIVIALSVLVDYSYSTSPAIKLPESLFYVQIIPIIISLFFPIYLIYKEIRSTKLKSKIPNF